MSNSSRERDRAGVLREAGIVGCERPGLWAYYCVIPEALKELSAWLS
jgi:ArsR family transcriptional regulator